MQFVDHIFILLLFVVQPIHGVFETRRHRALEKAGQPFNRVRFYRQTAVVEWAFLAVLFAAWLIYSRPISDLGFTMPGGPGFWIGVVLVVLMSGYFLYYWQWAKQASDTEKAKQVQTFAEVVMFIPHTIRELRNFYGISITAGIVEEIVFRGFVLWYLAQLMPVWAAVIVSSTAFGLAHSYQGKKGAVSAGTVGLGFGVLYVVSGSIWLPIVAHILLDVLQGAALQEILRRDAGDMEPQPA